MQLSFYVEKVTDETDWLLVGLLIGGICVLILLIAVCAVYKKKGLSPSSGLYLFNLSIESLGDIAVTVHCTKNVRSFYWFNYLVMR